MKEITRIHLAKIPYEIELDAKDVLNKYFVQLKKYTQDDSIFSDIEIRVTEILDERGIQKNGVISLEDVQQIKSQLGDPKIFADDQDNDDEAEVLDSSMKSEKRLYRDTQNGILGGVVAGLSLYFNIDVAILRIITVILAIFPITSVFVWFLYIVMCLVVSPAKTATDILRLKNEKISASNLRLVNEEYNFEAIDKRKKAIKKVLSIVAGVISLLIAFGGIFMIAIISPAILAYSSTDSSLYRVLYLSYGLFLAAGVSFVIFFLTLAYVFFMRKIKAWQIAFLIALIVVGITSFASGVITAKAGSDEIYNRQKIVKVKQIDVLSENIRNIKKITASGKINVRYVVSDEAKIEFHAPEIRMSQIEIPSVKIEGDNLKIEDHDKSNYGRIFFENHNGQNGYTLSETGVLIVHGPKIDKIEANQASVEYVLASYELNKKGVQDNLQVVQSGKSHVFIEGRSKIENLDMNIDDADFYGINTSVENLKLKTQNEGIVRLKNVEKAQVESDDFCLANERSILRLAFLEGEITLNNQKYDNPKSCFRIEKEAVAYDRG